MSKQEISDLRNPTAAKLLNLIESTFDSEAYSNEATRPAFLCKFNATIFDILKNSFCSDNFEPLSFFNIRSQNSDINKLLYIVIGKNFDKLLIEAAQNGNVGAVKWLDKCTTIDLSGTMLIFRTGANHGHTNILDWAKLNSIQFDDLFNHITNNDLRFAVAEGHIDVLNWISKNAPNPEIKNEVLHRLHDEDSDHIFELVMEAIDYKKTEVLAWFFNDLKNYQDTAYLMLGYSLSLASENDDVATIEWLIANYPFHDQAMIEGVLFNECDPSPISSALHTGSYKAFEWLIKRFCERYNSNKEKLEELLLRSVCMAASNNIYNLELLNLFTQLVTDQNIWDRVLDPDYLSMKKRTNIYSKVVETNNLDLLEWFIEHIHSQDIKIKVVNLLFSKPCPGDMIQLLFEREDTRPSKTQRSLVIATYIEYEDQLDLDILKNLLAYESAELRKYFYGRAASKNPELFAQDKNFLEDAERRAFARNTDIKALVQTSKSFTVLPNVSDLMGVVVSFLTDPPNKLNPATLWNNTKKMVQSIVAKTAQASVVETLPLEESAPSTIESGAAAGAAQPDKGAQESMEIEGAPAAARPADLKKSDLYVKDLEQRKRPAATSEPRSPSADPEVSSWQIAVSAKRHEGPRRDGQGRS